MDAPMGQVSGSSAKKRHLHLFNDLIMVSKPKSSGPRKYTFLEQHSLAHVRVVDVADRDGKQALRLISTCSPVIISRLDGLIFSLFFFAVVSLC
jgi:hypothetical protein